VQLEQKSCKLTDIPQLAGIKIAEGAVTAIHIPSASSDHSMGHALTAGSLKQPEGKEAMLRASRSSQIEPEEEKVSHDTKNSKTTNKQTANI